MRSRTISPSMFSNEKLVQCQPWAWILFQGLWCMADRNGNLEDRPVKIKAHVFPLVDVNPTELLNELIKHELVTRYQVGGKKYLSIAGWAEHAKFHPKEPVIYPEKPCDVIPSETNRESQLLESNVEERLPLTLSLTSFPSLPTLSQSQTDTVLETKEPSPEKPPVHSNLPGYNPELYPVAKKIVGKYQTTVVPEASRSGAEEAVIAVLRGRNHTPEELEKAIAHYAEWCRLKGKEGRYRVSAKNFFSNGYEDYVAGVPGQSRPPPSSTDLKAKYDAEAKKLRAEREQMESDAKKKVQA